MNNRRQLTGGWKLAVCVLAILIPVASVIYALQLLPRFGIVIYKEQFLALFLAFCVAITFFTKPPVAKDLAGMQWIDLVCALLALGVGGYIFIEYETIVRNLGLITTDKIIVSVIGLALLLEAARRHAGWAMVSVGLLALAYAFFGHYLSGMFETRVIRWDRLVTYNYLNAGAVFGIPLYVAATIVTSFVIFGQVLFLVGGGDAISDFALALMGRRRGGPAKVAIVSSAFFGSLSGSASANVATTGILTIPLMRRVGYSAEKAAAVEAVASTGGLVLPPVMAATGFLMAEFLGVPYATIALAAAVPALLFYFCLYLQVDMEAGKEGLTGVRGEELPDLRDASLRIIPVAVPFAVLLYALFGLNWNPAAAAFSGALSTVLLSLFLPKWRRSLLGYLRTIAAAGEAAVFIAIMCAVAGIVVGSLGLTGLGSNLSQNLVEISGDSVWMLLMFSAFGCIVLGMGVPVTATYIILIILIGPAMEQLGVDRLAAHMFIFYFGTLSFLTPPVCLSVFVAAAIAGSAPMRTALQALKFAVVAYIIPFAFVLNGSYLLIGGWQSIAATMVSGAAGVFMISFALVGFFVGPVALWLRGLALVAGLVAIFLVGHYWAVAPAAVALLVGFYAFQKRVSQHLDTSGRTDVANSEVAG
ncbi:TRAP transporter permease [Mesorhizobium xinjiangense]|uniref:TRAP transporter permease n=1 Tax=Mesorhizobium xinjiangense TaxID=2678685 RepID=UPI0012ED5D01|nr:TRAP transporter fused permease subunit [Mesorhizobium xinjiangense]